MALCYMSDYYIYKHNHIDVAVRKTSCEPEDKNFYINFDVHVGNIYNLILIRIMGTPSTVRDMSIMYIGT